MSTTTTIIIDSSMDPIICDRDLAREAGFDSSGGEMFHGGDALRNLARAMRDGYSGAQAVVRAIAYHADDLRAANDHSQRAKIADIELHAARVRRQAAALECRARGLSETASD